MYLRFSERAIQGRTASRGHFSFRVFEPAVTGGNPIMAEPNVGTDVILINNMLGLTSSNLIFFGTKLDNGKVDKYTYFTGSVARIDMYL